MDNLENQPSPISLPPDQDDLRAQLGSLTSLVNSILILLVVLAGAVDVFLMRQVKATRADLTTLRLYAAQVQRNAPAIDEFARKLADYGRTHPDFAPIMTKYGLKSAASTNAAPAAGASSSATKAKK